VLADAPVGGGVVTLLIYLTERRDQLLFFFSSSEVSNGMLCLGQELDHPLQACVDSLQGVECGLRHALRDVARLRRGPAARRLPEGKEKNWVATVPGKGYFIILA
jgi:hypothetical protein